MFTFTGKGKTSFLVQCSGCHDTDGNRRGRSKETLISLIGLTITYNSMPVIIGITPMLIMIIPAIMISFNPLMDNVQKWSDTL